MRPLIGSITVAFVALSAWAEGPGTRLRTTPEIPQAMELSVPPAPSAQPKPCDGLRGEMRERCLHPRREPDIERRASGPEATGTGSGAGSSASSNAASGPGAPR